MCEQYIVATTGLSVEEHRRRTIQNYLRLKELAPDLPFMPVLQGWTLQDYLHCVQLYEAAGVDLTSEPIVGVGSACRRQATEEIGKSRRPSPGSAYGRMASGSRAQALRPVSDER
jgi:hypothetical protein